MTASSGPSGGTFWLAIPDGIMPPSPCLPINLDFPIYQITDEIFPRG
jgi:hypothetical protein